jgi:serine/threonine protein kinase
LSLELVSLLHTKLTLNSLGFMHSKYIAHCDLKMGNILVCPHDGPVNMNRLPQDEKKPRSSLKRPSSKGYTAPLIKIIDFGLAKPANRERVYWPSNREGTTEYLSTELQYKIQHWACAPDSFSIGVIAYHLALGILPDRNVKLYGKYKDIDLAAQRLSNMPYLKENLKMFSTGKIVLCES